MGNPLRALRETLGMSQEELAMMVRDAGGRLTGGRVSQIEQGHGVLGPENLLIVMDLWRVPIARLGMSAEDFLRRPDTGRGENGDRAAGMVPGT